MDLPTAISFENTEQDLLAVRRYFTRKSRVLKGVHLFAAFFFAFLAVQRTLEVMSENPERGTRFALISLVVTFLFGYLPWRLLAWLVYELFTRRTVAAVCKDKGVCCRHELIIDEESVTEKTEVNETRFLWSSVPKIEEEPDFILLYQTSHAAHIIPKRTFRSSDGADRFVSLIRELRERAQQ